MPYELDVDIIKDCSNFKNEIREVIDGIDKDGEDHPVMMEKVSVCMLTCMVLRISVLKQMEIRSTQSNTESDFDSGAIRIVHLSE